LLLGRRRNLPGAAEQPGKVFRIGILSPAARTSTKVFDGFRKGLRELGYIDGENITIEYRLANGDFSRLPAMAADLVRLPVDVIVTDGGDKVAQIAHEATRTIPIVMGTSGDPVAAGLAASYPHPGSNVTGFTLHPVELFGKWLQLLKEAFPPVSRMAALRNPATAVPFLRANEEAARILGVQLRSVEVASPDGIEGGFETAIAGGAEALVIIPNAMFWNERAQILALAAQHRMPAIYPEREYADDGGLLAYGANVPDNFRRAAEYVDKILTGAKPGDLPIQQPTRFELVVNLKTAKELGLAIPPAILARADEVIDAPAVAAKAYWKGLGGGDQGADIGGGKSARIVDRARRVRSLTRTPVRRGWAMNRKVTVAEFVRAAKNSASAGGAPRKPPLRPPMRARRPMIDPRGRFAFVLVAIFLGVMAVSHFDHPTTTSGPAAYRAPTRAEILHRITIDSWHWHKGGFDNVMIVDFLFSNANPFDVKDITVKCTHSGPSGTEIDSNTRTIYQIVPAHAIIRVNEFNMGWIHSQAVSSSCRVTDYER
jgi:ABC-type uncharacterized transport system substrate-binding protein